jgi:glutamate-1-semialdehyde 2,1-aminomutase
MTNNLAFTGTFSKSPLAWGLPEDLTVKSAHGGMVLLSNNKWYYDWPCGLGPNILGYGQSHEKWYKAVEAALVDGLTAHSLPIEIEAEVAELLCHLLAHWSGHWCGDPNQLQVRFCKTGTEATTMAVKLARGVTGKAGIITMKGGYHGWADWSQAWEEPGHGVPILERDVLAVAQYNKPSSLKDQVMALKLYRDEYGEQAGVAAVIIEQPLEPPEPGYYQAVRQFCDDNNALFIRDEIVTGLRFGMGGASGYYGIKPDIVCMGKALGNGLPIAAVVGHKDQMKWFAQQNPVFASSTFWGEGLGLAAARAMLELYDDQGPEIVKRLHALGREVINGLSNAGWEVAHDLARSLVKFSNPQEQAFFIQGMFKEKHLCNRPNFVCLAHEDVSGPAELAKAARKVRAKYKAALERGTLSEKVEGKLPRPLFTDR